MALTHLGGIDRVRQHHHGARRAAGRRLFRRPQRIAPRRGAIRPGAHNRHRPHPTPRACNPCGDAIRRPAPSSRIAFSTGNSLSTFADAGFVAPAVRSTLRGSHRRKLFIERSSLRTEPAPPPPPAGRAERQGRTRMSEKSRRSWSDKGSVETGGLLPLLFSSDTKPIEPV